MSDIAVKSRESEPEAPEGETAVLRYNPQKTSILLIKHAQSMRDVNSYVLQSLGFLDVMGCENAEEAMETLIVAQSDNSTMDVKKIDLVITDWSLPEGSALELIEKIRASKNERISSLPVIAVMGGNDEAHQEALEKGFQAVLPKPASIEDWVQVLKTITIPSSEEEPDAPDFPAEAMKSAQKQVDDYSKYAPKLMGRTFEDLLKLWDKARKMKSPVKRKEITDQMFFQADEISELADICGLSLVSDFAGSLRDYVAHEREDVKAQHIILQAHIAVIQTALKQKIKEGGDAFDQLKAAVQKAIAQNS